MPKSLIPAAGEAMPAEGQLIPFHPAIREFEALNIPWDYVPGPEKFNRQNLVAIRCAIAICNKSGAELLTCAKGMADLEPDPDAFEDLGALDALRVNWLATFNYFEILMGIITTAQKRIETCAQVAGIKLREVA